MTDPDTSLLDNRIRMMLNEMEQSGGGGGGGERPPLDSRVARLEALAESGDGRMSRIEDDVRGLRNDQKTDFRVTWGAIIFVALGLAWLLAKGFNWL